MDIPEATPPKLRRGQTRVNLQVSECIRQFKLPQQFPSTVVGHIPIAREHSLSSPRTLRTVSEMPLILSKNRNRYNISVPNKPRSLHRVVHCPEEMIRVSSPSGFNEMKKVQKNPSFSNGINIIQKASSSHLLTNQKANPISSTNSNAQNKLQKLKLKSPDGKDLGEFQVQVLGQQRDNLKRKLITVAKQTSSMDESQGISDVSSTQGESVVSYSINDVQYPGMIYQEPRISRVGSELPPKPNIISQISLKGSAGAPIGQVMKNLKNTVISIKKSQVDLKSGTNNPWVKMDTKRITISNKVGGSTSTSNSSNTKKVLYLRPEDHPYLKNITQSGKPISLKPLQLKSLGLNKNGVVGENSSEVLNFMGTAGLQGFQNGDFDEEFEDGEVTNVYDLDQNQLEGSSSIGRKRLKVMMSNSAEREFSSQSYSGTSSDMGGSMHYSDEEDELGSSDTFDTDDSLDHGLIQRNKCIVNEERPVIKNTVQNRIRQRNCEKRKMRNLMQKNTGNVLAEQEGSSDMNILERALASVKDKTLREEALKVLATCKLGVERQDPIRPPSDTISVRETTTQTNIFGNLERECEEFIEVKEDVKGIKRIKKEQRNYSLVSKSFNAILSPVDENHTGNQYTTQLDSMLQNLDLDIAGTQEIKQIKEVLNKPIRSNERFDQIRTQMQKDVKMLMEYDENGLLGLHKAVMEDNSIAVKRLLMILKISKKNIDVKTLDGKTSLELAVKTDASPDIVNALLEAGAKPTSTEAGHDSALIIASKNSSPLLPQLVKYAKDKALDSMDSEGFAAIHLCALRGNAAAINALVGAGADINLQDCRSGRTALFHAIENQHPETARAILAAGATPNIRNNDGQTILPLLDDIKNQALKPVIYKSMKW